MWQIARNPLGSLHRGRRLKDMQVEFHRTDAQGGYAVLMRRDDGLTVRMTGYDRTRRLPHDMAHFVTERELRLNHGVFGSIAAGAMFSNMAVVDGRLRYDGRARSRAVIRAYRSELGLAEVVAGVLHDGIEQRLDPETLHRRLQSAWGTMRPGPCPYQAIRVRRCLEIMARLGLRWRAVDVGDRMALRWDL
jgi:hypothetical protein